jgi:hypothetical protein
MISVSLSLLMSPICLSHVPVVDLVLKRLLLGVEGGDGLHHVLHHHLHVGHPKQYMYCRETAPDPDNLNRLASSLVLILRT